MTSVIDLAAFRERRARGKGFSEPRTQHDPGGDYIQLQLQPNGSYQARITGGYAEDPTLAITALIDAATRLSADAPADGIGLMAEAIGYLSELTRRPSATLT